MQPNKPVVLVVDDDPVNLDILVQTLEQDYFLIIAKNGKRALDLAFSHHPDLILLDILMPDGFPSTLDHQKATSPEGKLMGHVDVNEHRAEAEKACAGYYVRKDRDLPPVFLLHGTKDRTVFCEQSVLLFRKLKDCGKDVSLTLVRGADHGSCIFWSDPVLKDVADFFHRCMPE